MNLLITTSSFGAKDDCALNLIRESGYQAVLNPFGRTLTEVEIGALLAEHRPAGLIAGLEPLTARVMEGAVAHLRVISRCGTGLDNVDLEAAKKHSIAVLNTPAAPAEAVAELSLGLILALMRNIVAHDQTVRSGAWKKRMGFLLSEITVGIVGLGRVGKRVAAMLRPLGTKLVATYKKALHPCEVVATDNGIAFQLADGKTYMSPSSAGKAITGRVSCDGWKFWSLADGQTTTPATDVVSPEPKASLHLHEARNVYVARTYAYVSGGHEGLIIVDVKNPLEPKVDQIYTANGCIGDLNDVKLGITCNSEFAYLADGHNGMHVVQLTNADTPGTGGFATRLTPQLIATRKLPKEGHAVCISEGVDRDRAVDEAGNQLSVFGRIGARPFNLEEQRRVYMHNGQVWKVTNDPKDPSFLFRSASRDLKPAATVRR